jgi:hypothetical protein
MTRKNQKLEELLNSAVNVDVESVAHALYEGLDTPVSLGCHLRLKYGEYSQLCSMGVEPINYSSMGIAGRLRYFADKQAVSFLKKYPGLPTGINTADVALDTFWNCERQCAATNELFSLAHEGKFSLGKPMVAVLQHAKWLISKILGELDLEEWLQCCRFGPGTVVGCPGTSDLAKTYSRIAVTPEFEPLALGFLEEFPGWCLSNTHDGELPLALDVYHGGTFFVVPKDSTTDRCAEKQPLLNAFAQAGLGRVIRSRLYDFGIDLNDQTTNQRLALQGSLTGRLATLDLKNASDNISCALVKELLPPTWYHALDSTRTHKIFVSPEGSTHSTVGRIWKTLERFSSMGNGFTFELETLIFYAISRAACESPYSLPAGRTHKARISVYGDDIIVDAEKYQPVAAALEMCGFQVNRKKSFSSGPFRESCGTDYWQGVNVRPFFLKKELSNVADVISLANGLRRAAYRSNCSNSYDRKFASAYYHCLRRVPVSIRNKLAAGFTATDEFILSHRVRKGYALHFKTETLDANYYPAKGAALYRAWAKSLPEVEIQSLYRTETNVVVPPIGMAALTKLGLIPIDTRVQVLATPPETGAKRMSDYRRDAGTWVLRRIPSWQVNRQEGYDGWF